MSAARNPGSTNTPEFFGLNPVPREDGPSGPVPAFLGPLSRAARDNLPLEPPMLEIVGALGFSGVAYGFTNLILLCT